MTNEQLKAGESIVDFLYKQRSVYFTPKQLSAILKYPNVTIYRAVWRLERNDLIKGKAMHDESTGHWVRHYTIE